MMPKINGPYHAVRVASNRLPREDYLLGMQALPIDSELDSIVAAAAGHGCVVVQAPPGAGKTTRVPSALLDAGVNDKRQIVVLEPRRIAARSAAGRVAWERNSPIGGEVGFAVRFEHNYSAATKILFVTEGVFLRMLDDDPFLEAVGVVVFDEFHERSLDADLALALSANVRREVRPDLKIVAMSATLDAAPVATFLGDCPIVTSLGRLFPVEVEQRNLELGLRTRELPTAIRAAISDLLEKTPGDILVFLPGVGEIRRCGNELAGLAAANNIAICELFGDLPAEQQDAVIRSGPRRKIILATNVAETSITVDGVTGVVDSGLARIMRTDPRVGLDRLELSRISKASAEQRAGRAGRTAAGHCIRLWSAAAHARLNDRETPAVRRVDLAGPALRLLNWGERDLNHFCWLEAPAPHTLDAARILLDRLGTIDDSGSLSDIGRGMARLPVHPRLARLMIEAHRYDAVDAAARIASLLGERDPFSDGFRAAQHTSESDLLDRLDTFDRFAHDKRSSQVSSDLNVGAARFVLRAAEQLARTTIQEFGRPGRCNIDIDEALGRSLLAGFPDRLCRRRDSESRRAVMVGGRGVRLHDQSAVSKAELFLAIEADAGAAEDVVYTASAVAREWLPANLIESKDELVFEEPAMRVWGRRQSRWYDLVLDEVPVTPRDAIAVAELLARNAATRVSQALPIESDGFANFRARVLCLREWIPELELPALDEDYFRERLPEWCEGRRSFTDLQKLDLTSAVRNQLTHRQSSALEREAPERIAVPSGSKIALKYEVGRPPILPVRIQELFGMTDTPRVAGGRVGVLLHLLAPNHRPQQVTDDLRSFWTNIYPLIRKELRARYPRHAWPEDPLAATPERRPKRRPR